LKPEANAQITQLQQTVKHREASLLKIFKCFGSVNSVEMVIAAVENLRSQVNQLQDDLLSYKVGHSFDSVFSMQAANDEQFLRDMRQLLVQHGKVWKGMLNDIQEALEQRQASRIDILGVIRTAEAQNQRLLDLLSESGKRNPIDIEVTQSLRPFALDHDLFLKRQRRIQPVEQPETGTLL
jgi:hypothetical protein